MRIGLIDCDKTSFPNLALMKLSAYHKERGDEVEWYMPFSQRYDRVYVSKVFSTSADYDEVINAKEVFRGGTGYEISVIDGKEVYTPTHNNLPYDIEHTYPDYSLYRIKDTAYGYLTRGCPRGCDFCIVGKKEGRSSIKVADLSEFWRGQKNIVLLDPNILACREAVGLLHQLSESKAYVDFNQGLDIRLMTQEKAELIKTCKIKEIHFAWDKFADRDIILPRLVQFSKWVDVKRHGHYAIVYVLVNFHTTFEQDLERIYALRDIGYWPYVMIYDKAHCAQKYKDLQRWCNNRIIFSKCPKFENYKK